MKQKLHLCLDLRLITAPGIGRFLKTLLSFLFEIEEIRLSFLCYRKDLFFIINLDKENKSEKILCKASVYSLVEQWELPKKIPKCDVFWSPHYNIPIREIKAKVLISTVHDVFHLTHFTPFYQRIYAKLMFFLLNKKSKFITTCSHFTYDQYLSFLGNKRSKDIFIIHYAVSLGIKTIIPTKLRKDIILYVGSLQKRKNIFRLIKAYNLLRPKEKLFIVGPKKGKSIDSRIFNLIEDNSFLKNNVILINSVSEQELVRYYSFAKIFVFPSLYEGFGYPPLEAMQSGTPVVVSNIPCLREICGEAALFFDAYSENDMAKTLCYVLNNLKLQQLLQKKGLTHVKKYNLSKMKDSILRVIYESSDCS